MYMKKINVDVKENVMYVDILRMWEVLLDTGMN